MKIAITGGAGYIGSAVAEKLSFLPEVEEVRVFDNLSTGNTDFFFNSHLNKEKIKFIEGDILETRKLPKLLKDIDVLVHLASFETSASDNASLHTLEQVNHWGTAELSFAIENSGIKRVVHLSTHEVYGFSYEGKTESSEAAPETPFAVSKLRGESQIIRLKDKLNTVVLRPGTVVGHSAVKNISGVANKMFYDALIKKRVSIHGDGKQIRPLVSLSYLISTIEFAVLGHLNSDIYNISQANISVLDMLDEVKTVLPETEFIFTNHHFSLPHISMATKFGDLLPKQEFSLKHEYEQILKYFRI
ncbi:MAG: NAD(P)-dependent oxidoreductase [Opitutaceae bacterium]|nr:NAD(P)-dependent oxidoreductase [Cytophagales bacterium]